MDFKAINEQDCIIAPTYLHDEIYKNLLAQKGNVKGITLDSLETLLSDETMDTSLLAYYDTMKTLKPSLTYLQDSCLSFAFLQEVQTFMIRLKEAHLTPLDLPQDNPLEIELAQILSVLYPIPLEVDTHDAKINALLKDVKHMYIVDAYSSFYEKSIVDRLCNEGAKRISFEQYTPQKEYYYSVNIRQEVECVAQMIAVRGYDAKQVKITLLSNDYVPFVNTIFHHYGIPFTLQASINPQASLLKEKYKGLLAYWKEPSSEQMQNLLSLHVFDIPYSNQLATYLSVYEKDILDDFHTLDDLSITNNIMEQQEIEQLQKLEAAAQESQAELLPFIQHLLSQANGFEACRCIDAYLLLHHHFSKDDRAMLGMIRKKVSLHQELLEKDEGYELFLSMLDKLNVCVQNPEEGVLISDLMHPYPEREIQFILGTTESNYPNMPCFEGIFNEDYVAKMNFPSLQERYDLHMKQCQNVMESCSHLIISYPSSTFEGKGNEASLWIERYVEHKAIPFPYLENYVAYHRRYQINQDIAQQLYLKNNILKGSISSLEKYMSCPYAYFLRYGLKIKEPMEYNLNPAKMGTLYHYVLQCLCAQYGKAYADASQVEVETILDAKIQEMQAVYPNKKHYLNEAKQRILDSLMDNLRIWQDQEQHSSLQPTYMEVDFSYELPLSEKKKLKLHGFVDRIDTNHDFFRIIDYKSSKRDLKEEKVFAGTQLQLVTYLTVMEEQLNLIPLGAYYYNFKNNSFPLGYAKFSKKPLEIRPHNQMDIEQEFHKRKRLSGWSVCDEAYLSAMDDDGSHIVGLSFRKSDQYVKATKLYDFDVLKSLTKEILTQIAQRILSGDITSVHTEDACKFCHYRSLCMDEKNVAKPELMVELDDSLYLKKRKGGK